jgi:hypothetical protein
MYQPMLFLHWKQARTFLALAVVAAFALPLLASEGVGAPRGVDVSSLDAYRFGFEAWLPFFPALAILIGMTLALTAWNWDHRFDHVYALSLPVTRWQYTVQKMLAGVTLALLPAVGFWLGANVAAASIALPEGLNAYPNELAVRFFFAILLSYTMLFAAAAGTIRTTMWVAGVILCFVFFGNIANDFLGYYYDFFARENVVLIVFEWMFETAGPFEVFSGSWSLIDV